MRAFSNSSASKLLLRFGFLSLDFNESEWEAQEYFGGEPAPNSSGVYAFSIEEVDIRDIQSKAWKRLSLKLVYIGMSVKLGQRINSNTLRGEIERIAESRKHDATRSFFRAYFKYVPVKFVREVEWLLINRYKPPFNILGATKAKRK